MTNNKREFESFLKNEGDKKTAQIDWNSRKEEWLLLLNALYSDIQGWLNDYIKSGQIKIDFNDIALYEEAIGRYHAKELIIHIGSHIATLTPVGTVLIGTNGRVDLVGRFDTIKFILADKKATKPNITAQLVLEDVEEDADLKQAERLKLASQKTELVWKISSNPPSIYYTDLDEDSFYNCLIKVING